MDQVIKVLIDDINSQTFQVQFNFLITKKEFDYCSKSKAGHSISSIYSTCT